MSRLLVVEVLSGSVVGVSFDTGEQLDVSVAVVDHNDKRVYRIGEANDGGGEEILASVKRGDCDDSFACDAHGYNNEVGAHGYTDEDDEADNEPQGCSHCWNPAFSCACGGGVGRQTEVEVIK
jgi:hypothetical protein